MALRMVVWLLGPQVAGPGSGENIAFSAMRTPIGSGRRLDEALAVMHSGVLRAFADTPTRARRAGR